ncbi:MAG TPA: FkbM family methyltransferase [Gammaproteobacteria bacterium]|jgi:FkbM family methyltransferase|nr:FkbM family methyltransferase [Gammaproteobacteria bacterium]
MSIFTKSKQRFRRHKLKQLGIEPVSCKTSALYGGDHGWVVDESLLNRESVIYSVGVGSNIDFDIELINSFGATVHAFDPTPRSIEWVKNQQLPKHFIFHPFGLSAENGHMDFFPPAKASSTHFSPIDRYGDTNNIVRAPVKDIDTIASELKHKEIDLLKMDIEGAEYEVIEALPKNRVAINQILIEFHHMYKGVPISKTVDAISTLSNLGFELFNISQRTYEFSFRKKGM